MEITIEKRKDLRELSLYDFHFKDSIKVLNLADHYHTTKISEFEA